jgi:hypothetical protein
VRDAECGGREVLLRVQTGKRLIDLLTLTDATRGVLGLVEIVARDQLKRVSGQARVVYKQRQCSVSGLKGYLRLTTMTEALQ